MTDRVLLVVCACLLLAACGGGGSSSSPSSRHAIRTSVTACIRRWSDTSGERRLVASAEQQREPTPTASAVAAQRSCC